MKLIVEKIIDELINTRKDLTAKELAERIDVSESSIKHNISIVKEELEKFGLCLINVPQKGFGIRSMSEGFEENIEENIQKLREGMAGDPSTSEFRRNYIMETLLNYEKSYSVSLFAEELHVGRSVILNDLKELNEAFVKFHIELLTRKNSGIIIEGNEFEIRQAIIFFQNERLLGKEYINAPQEIDPRISNRAWTFISEYCANDARHIVKIEDSISNIEQFLKQDFTDITYGRLLEYILVSQKRMRQGIYITCDLPGERLPLEEKYFEAADKLKNLFSNPEREYWKYERMFLAARIYVASTVNGVRNAVNQDRIIAKVFLSEIKNSIGGYFNPDDDLVNCIANLVNMIRYRSNYRIYDWLDISYEVRKKYTSLYALVMLHISLLEEDTGLELQKDDIATLVLLLVNHMRNHKQEVVFVTASTVEQSNYNIEKLKENFPYLDFVKCVFYKDFRFEDYSNQLIISSVNLKIERKNLLYVTKHVSEEDIEAVKNKIGSIDSENNIIFQIYKEELILDMSAVDKKDVLKKIAEHMKSCGYVEEGFYQELMNREQKYSTVIGKGLAIPHVYLKAVKKSGVSVIRLNNKVRWSDNGWTDIIFCFAIGDEKSEDIKKIFEHMYWVLENRSLLEDIRAAKDSAEILSLLLNNC